MTEPYKVLVFAKGDIPEGLKRDHSLKSGVRGELMVTEGTVVFVDESGHKRTVQPNDTVHIAPTRIHHLEQADDAAIEIRFFRVDT